uniref:Uncharacterized protein n=1 Tax=Myoviridae sp. ctPuP5 TaxID=2823543 RepID=A0A8S5L9M5_9CAUD|nr:MAG TPA: hypothetical protein [Myoviridae sp. ctPuP5]
MHDGDYTLKFYLYLFPYWNTTKIRIIIQSTKHYLNFNITLTQNSYSVNFVLNITFYLRI